MTKLTDKQQSIMDSIGHRVGETIDVITSNYDANIAPEFRARAVFLGTTSTTTLRGLETKGFIRIERIFWKGATLTVLKNVEVPA